MAADRELAETPIDSVGSYDTPWCRWALLGYQSRRVRYPRGCARVAPGLAASMMRLVSFTLLAILASCYSYLPDV